MIFGKSDANKNALSPSLIAFGVKTRFDPNEFELEDPYGNGRNGAGLPDRLVTPSQLLDVANVNLKMNQQTISNDCLRTDSCCVASNMPCQDNGNVCSNEFFRPKLSFWPRFASSNGKITQWGIYDGHAGYETSSLLLALLSQTIIQSIIESNVLDRGYIQNDEAWKHVLKSAFVTVDARIMALAKAALSWSVPSGSAQTFHLITPAIAGSGALQAIYDHRHSVLRVACVGDSRAVLGRFESQSGRYKAIQLSEDQTGFNSSEVARIEEEHPGEEGLIDPKTGCLHGLAVIRASGNARWKWDDETNQKAHERFWAYKPMPQNANKTPPYLTAEPVISESRIQRGRDCDFLILASKGFSSMSVAKMLYS